MEPDGPTSASGGKRPDGGYPAASDLPAQASSTAETKVFNLDGDVEDDAFVEELAALGLAPEFKRPRPESEEIVWAPSKSLSSDPGSPPPQPHKAGSSQEAESQSWWDLDDSEAKECEQQLAQFSEASEASQKSGLGGLLGQAKNNFRLKATPFFSKARQAIIQETKLIREDIVDVASGVSQGFELTKQDLQGILKPRSEPSKNSPLPAEQSASSSSSPRAGEAEVTPKPALQTLKDNFAVTKDVSKELLKDIMGVKQEVLLQVNDLKNNVLRKGRDSEQAQESISASQEYWLLPSTRANYAQLSLAAEDSAWARAEAAEVESESAEENPEASNTPGVAGLVLGFGGKLKGSLAKFGEDIRQNIEEVRQEVRQEGYVSANLMQAADESPLGKIMDPRLKKRVFRKMGVAKASPGAGPQAKTGDHVSDGEDIFEIGSDEDDAWSDDDFGLSEASTISASLAAGSTDGATEPQEPPK